MRRLHGHHWPRAGFEVTRPRLALRALCWAEGGALPGGLEGPSNNAPQDELLPSRAGLVLSTPKGARAQSPPGAREPARHTLPSLPAADSLFSFHLARQGPKTNKGEGRGGLPG